MDFKINNIHIQNLRGICNLALPVNGQNLIIVGENGSGKSSVVDALEYYFTGHVERLEGRADVDQRQCLPNLNGGPTKVHLTFKGVGPETGISLSYPGRSASIPDELQAFFDLAASKRFALRRYQLLGFINSRDAERYQHISSLVGLEALDKIEDRWRREFRKVIKQVEALVNHRGALYQKLGGWLGQAVQDEVTLMAAINAQLSHVSLPPIQDIQQLQERQAHLRQLAQSPEDVSKAEQLAQTRDQIDALQSNVNALIVEYEKLSKSVRAFWKYSMSLEDAEFESLLTEGYRVLQSHRLMQVCPLCEAPISDYAALLSRLDARRKHLNKLIESRRRVTQRKQALVNSLGWLNERAMALRHRLQVHGLDSCKPWLQAVLDFVAQWRHMTTEEDWSELIAQRLPEHQTLHALQYTLPELKQEIDQRIRALSPTEDEATALDLLLTLTRIEEPWRQLRAVARDLKSATYVHRQIDLVYTTLVETRKRGLGRISRELQDNFAHLYKQLHPDEGYEAITLEVQKDKRSSVALRVKFHQQDAAHPLNYLSEGHLDSLGLCIFLAFIKRYNGDFKLIVLDDVLTTVDVGHRLRAAQLLASEFSDYQLIITTHDRLWAEELKIALPQARLYHLKPWHFGRGAECHQTPISDWAYYAQQADDHRPQHAIAGAGRNLEKFLYQMRNNLSLAVPAKPGDDYTIGDLYGPFFKWLRQHSIQRQDWPGFDADLRAMERELDEVWRLRNWSGAHFNTWAVHVTRAEALSLLTAIKNLVDAFSCPVCHGLVVYDKQASMLLCPYCRPEPQPPIVYQYKATWPDEARRMLNLPNAKVRAHIPRLVQSALSRFMHDMRYRLLFPLPPKKDNVYHLSDLYGPFFAWAEAHPRPGIADWEIELRSYQQSLDAYWQNDHWAHIPESDIVRFVHTVQQLTACFTCKACGQLLDYDNAQKKYVCTYCESQQTAPEKISASWAVFEK